MKSHRHGPHARARRHEEPLARHRPDHRRRRRRRLPRGRHGDRHHGHRHDGDPLCRGLGLRRGLGGRAGRGHPARRDASKRRLRVAPEVLGVLLPPLRRPGDGAGSTSSRFRGSSRPCVRGVGRRCSSRTRSTSVPVSCPSMTTRSDRSSHQDDGERVHVRPGAELAHGRVELLGRRVGGEEHAQPRRGRDAGGMSMREIVHGARHAEVEHLERCACRPARRGTGCSDSARGAGAPCACA